MLAYKDGNYGPVNSHLLNGLLVYINFVFVCFKTWTCAMILELAETILYGNLFYINGPPRLWGWDEVQRWYGCYSTYLSCAAGAGGQSWGDMFLVLGMECEPYGCLLAIE